MISARAHEEAAAVYAETGRTTFRDHMLQSAYRRWLNLGVSVRTDWLAKERPWLGAHDLVRPELREVQRLYARPTNLAICAVFLLSIPVALVNTVVAVLMWPLVLFFAGRKLGDRLVSLRRT